MAMTRRRLNRAAVHVTFPTGSLDWLVRPATDAARDPLALAGWLVDVAREIRRTAKRVKKHSKQPGEMQ